MDGLPCVVARDRTVVSSPTVICSKYKVTVFNLCRSVCLSIRLSIRLSVPFFLSQSRLLKVANSPLALLFLPFLTYQPYQPYQFLVIHQYRNHGKHGRALVILIVEF